MAKGTVTGELPKNTGIIEDTETGELIPFEGKFSLEEPSQEIPAGAVLTYDVQDSPTGGKMAVNVVWQK